MLNFLLGLCILFPIAAGGAIFFAKDNALQKNIVVLTGGVLAAASLLLITYVPAQTTPDSGLASFLHVPIIVCDFLLLAAIFFIGLRRMSTPVMALAGLQLAGMVVLKFFWQGEAAAPLPVFTLDSLAIVMVLVVSIIGSAIAYYADGYMREHEAHLGLRHSRRNRFFAFILVFLGAMNALSLADDLSWMFFFWEVTTLCSFLLIEHDGTAEAKANALNALVINMLGGAAFVFALLFLQRTAGTLSLTALMHIKMAGELKTAMLMIPMVALCVAGFTKSAQIPFQSWLCGAMVAPTPVSALLHSSTMVKAGVYLVLRLAPLYAGTTISSMVAVCGAFTFFAAAALAAGQSNGKRILAYSTISNLGLIIACAGINTTASIAAGIMLLVFHAISKGLMFLCVGTIEQKIGSRDIEDMRGLFTIMPRTALIASFAILTMMLPPFGMLLAKWMALESAIDARAAMPAIVAMLALGSGITVLFWARWAGIMLGSATTKLVVAKEKQDPGMALVLRGLAYAAGILSLLAPIVYMGLALPAAGSSTTAAGHVNPTAIYAVYPIYFLVAVGFRYAWNEAKKAENMVPSLPYMSGIQAEQNGEVGFIGPMKTFVPGKSGNYYLEAFFGENRLTKPVNMVGLVLLVMLLGGVLQ